MIFVNLLGKTCDVLRWSKLMCIVINVRVLLWLSDPVRPRFLAITSSDLARSLSNFRTLHFSPSANFCQYGLLTKNR